MAIPRRVRFKALTRGSGSVEVGRHVAGYPSIYLPSDGLGGSGGSTVSRLWYR